MGKPRALVSMTLPMAVLAIVTLLLDPAFAATSVSEKSVEQSKETLTIKNKLATAEGRVSDLISRLDSVSDDASRAKGEIHNTLMEVWKVVDLLGRDQCGAVVDKVRIAQKKAEARVVEFQEEIRDHQKETESLKLQMAKRGDVIASLQTEVKAERSRRETLEAESRDLRDKLHWANAVSNETEKYQLVADRLQNLLVIVSERTILLNRISTMMTDAHSGFNDWQKEIHSLTGLVRQSDRDFAGGYHGAAVDGFKRQISDLETRLRNAVSTKKDLMSQRDDLRHKLTSAGDDFSRSTVSSISTPGKTRERIVRRTDSSGNWVGWLTFGLVSCCTGALVVVTYMGLRPPLADVGVEQVGDAHGKFGGFPSTSPGRASGHASPAGAPSMSPLTYVNPGSGSRTPGSRGSTPRRF